MSIRNEDFALSFQIHDGFLSRQKQLAAKQASIYEQP
jgi:hypothetical protein